MAGAGRGAEPPKAHAVTRARPAARVTSAAPRRLASGCRWAVTWAPPLNVAVSFLPPAPTPLSCGLGEQPWPTPLVRLAPSLQCVCSVGEKRKAQDGASGTLLGSCQALRGGQVCRWVWLRVVEGDHGPEQELTTPRPSPPLSSVWSTRPCAPAPAAMWRWESVPAPMTDAPCLRGPWSPHVRLPAGPRPAGRALTAAVSRAAAPWLPFLFPRVRTPSQIATPASPAGWIGGQEGTALCHH